MAAAPLPGQGLAPMFATRTARWWLVRHTIEPAGRPPESFAAFLRRDRERYAELVKMADIRPE